MAGNSHDIKALNGLVEGLVDSADGYHRAAVEAADDAYRTWFEARAAERRRLAEAFKAAAKDRDVALIWGGDWPRLRDGPHFELDRGAYP